MNQSSDFLDARSAAKLLGVKLPTLYAYASRGLVSSTPGGAGRARRYARIDLERLRARSRARSGHAAVASGALRWGEPVLESRITAIGTDGHYYRGHRALALAARGTSFESVCELLWSGALASERPLFSPWRAPKLRQDGSYIERMQCAVPLAALEDPMRFDPGGELDRARGIVRGLAGAIGRPCRAETVAEAALSALGARPSRERQRAVDRVLVLCADHELNVSAFAARVVASAGADLYACVSAALAAFSGPVHGAASDRVEALLDEVAAPGRARAVLRERARRGEASAGFGHPLYPGGDPRARALIELARTSRTKPVRLKVLYAVLAAVRAAGQPPPNLDAGLVAVRIAFGLPRGAASALFALGRAAGWIAHALEQRSDGYLLRPRARYVGPDVRAGATAQDEHQE
jgi:citrate synthase